MIGHIFQLTNKDGLSIKFNDFVTDPSNFIALQEYPQFDVDVKNTEIQKEGQHGIWDFSSFYGKRSIQFAGIIVGSSEANVEAIKRQFLQVVALPAQPDSTRTGYVTLKWTDSETKAWQIEVKLDRSIRFDRNMKRKLMLSFILTLKAPNPTIESQTLQQLAGVRGWQIGGFLLPTLAPITLGPQYGNILTATNAGSAGAYTTVRMYGGPAPITNPRIKNGTTGTTFKVNITLNNASEYIEVNSKTATVVDQNGIDRSGLVDGSSQYIYLIPGPNKLIYMSDESDGLTNPMYTGIIPSEVFTVSFRDSIV